MKKLLTIMIALVFIFSVAFVIAGGTLLQEGLKEISEITIPTLAIEDKTGITWDNLVTPVAIPEDKLSIVDDAAKAYPAIEIYDRFDLPLISSKVMSAVLEKHTATCGVDCMSQFEMTTTVDSRLVDSVKFYTLQLDENGNEIDRYEQDIRDYQFYIKSYDKEVLVDDYGTICKDIGLSKNGTMEQSCTSEIVGNHIEYEPVWLPYNYEVMPAGTYVVKLEGQKAPTRIVDWVMTSQGKEISDWSTWGASPLGLGLQAYYSFNNNTADQVAGKYNFTGAMSNITGRVGNGLNFGGANFLTSVGYLPKFGTGDFTMSLWVKSSDGCGVGVCGIIDNGNGWAPASGGWFLGISPETAGNGKIALSSNPPWASPYGEAVAINDGNWKHIIVTRQGTKLLWYTNSVNTFNSTLTYNADYNLDTTAYIGKQNSLGRYYNGYLDEVGMWNRSLTQTEINQLYNSGNGLTYTDFGGSSYITLNSPSDNYNTLNPTITFNATAVVIGGASLTNMSLWDNSNGTWKLNKTNILTGTTNTTTFQNTYNDGSYIWGVQGCDSDGVCGFSSNQTVTVDRSAPLINILTPQNGTIFYTYQYLTGVVSTSGTQPTDKCYYSINGATSSLMTNLTSGIESPAVTYTNTGSNAFDYGEVFTMKITANLTKLTKWSSNTRTTCALTDATGSDLVTGTFVGNDCPINYVLTNGTTYRVYTRGSGVIGEENIPSGPSYPLNGNLLTWTGAYRGDITSVVTDRWTGGIQNLTFTTSNSTNLFTTYGTINVTQINNNISVTCNNTLGTSNTSVSYYSRDIVAPVVNIYYPSGIINGLTAGQNLTLNFSATDINPDTCWKEYNNVNTTISCTTNSTIVYASGINSVKVWANDTVGNVNVSVSNWSTSMTINSITYNFITYESQTEYFIANITYNSSKYTSIYATFNYDGAITTIYNNQAGDNIVFNVSKVIPSIVTIQDKIFNWTFSLNDGTQINITSYDYNQTINKLYYLVFNSTCYNGLTSAFNFNFMDESNYTYLNASVNYNIKYGYSGNSSAATVFGNLSTISSFNICINNSFPAFTTSYGEIQYSSPGYTDRRFYIFSNTRLTNQTINNTLYLLPNGQATSFLFTAQDNRLNIYNNSYLSLLRWYPNLNSYNIVEMAKTDDKGQSIMRVKTEDVDYRVGIYEQDGTLIKLLDPIRMACISSPCTYSVFVVPGITDYVSSNGVQGNLSWNNNTQFFTYIWNDPSQLTHAMNLTVYKDGGLDSIIVCSNTASGYTGVISCFVGNQTGTLRAMITRSASPFTPIDSLVIQIRDTLAKIANGQTMGLFLAFLLAATMALIGVFSPTAAMILAVIGLIPAIFLGAINMMVGIGIGILAFIVFHTLRRTGTG